MGDLLSDQGYVVYRNAELLSPFQPTGGVGTFGLDALFVVTDVRPRSPAASKTRLGLPQFTNAPPGSLAFQWTGGGRVVQLERATNLTGPFVPLSPIIPDTTCVDAGTLTNQSQGFYRLHQW